ncbi:MAG TPA: hypothetical protein VNB94_04965 [Mycobacteriales bacterium]|nr:hypothetical protein [Mycobacteriales bacterium]
MALSRCGAPVVVPGVFSAASADTGRTCVRAAGHEGVHRWTAAWAALTAEQVEDEVARDAALDEPSLDD